MHIKREWATPITIGAFLLSSVTGILMFFHLDTNLNKVAHEWLSWVFLLGVILHTTTNFTSFKKYFTASKGRWLMGLFAILLFLSFMPIGGNNKPPFVAPLQVLAKTPLSTLALISNSSPEQLLERLAKANITAKSKQQSVKDLVGDDFRKQIKLLNLLLVLKK